MRSRPFCAEPSCYRPVMDNRDICQAATVLIKQYGEDAALQAGQRADDMLARGDIDGQAVWLRIRVAVQELLKERPGDREAVQ